MTFRCVTRMIGGCLETWQTYDPLSPLMVGLTLSLQLSGARKETE